MQVESTTVNFVLVNYGSRVKIVIDETTVASFSIPKRPTGDRELAKLLRELVRLLESPNVEDPGLI